LNVTSIEEKRREAQSRTRIEVWRSTLIPCFTVSESSSVSR
jgi:hypothetical protein